MKYSIEMYGQFFVDFRFVESFWNSTQNILHAHWKVRFFYTTLKFREHLDLTDHVRFKLKTHVWRLPHTTYAH